MDNATASFLIAEEFTVSEQIHKIEPVGPVTRVITRTVQPGHETHYQQLMLRMVNESLVFPDSLGVSVLSPEPGQGNVYHLTHTFSDAAAARAWEGSAVFRRLSEEADVFSTAQRQTDDSGLETSPSAPSESALPPPAKWKMALATFVVAYVLTAVIIPREQAWFPKTWSFYATNVITNVLLAVGITYLGLPLVNRVLRRWLYPGSTPLRRAQPRTPDFQH